MHGYGDIFSRRTLWLEVASTNKNPNDIVEFFLTIVQQLCDLVDGVPGMVRTDKGTENMWVSIIQRLYIKA